MALRKITNIYTKIQKHKFKYKFISSKYIKILLKGMSADVPLRK